MQLFGVNKVIEWGEGDSSVIEKILWFDDEVVYVINPEANQFPIQRMVSEVQEALGKGHCRYITYVSQKEKINVTSLSQREDKKRIENLEKTWNIVKPLIKDTPDIFHPKLRGILVREACEKHGLTRPTMDQYLKDYWKHGKNGLVDLYDACGGKGKSRAENAPEEGKKRGRPRHNGTVGVNVTKSMFKNIRIAVELFYLQEKLKKNKAFRKMLGRFYNVGYSINEDGNRIPILPEDKSLLPTKEVFNYHLNKILEEEDLEAARKRYGQRAVNLKFRAKTGNTTREAYGPGARFQIDATIGDVYLISSYREGRIIKKPVIFVVMDVFSRLVTGFYIGHESSYLGAMMAILNTGTPKKDFCAMYGVTINEEHWPCCGMPDQFTADRGELLTDNNKHIVNSIEVDIEFMSPYRADWKPIIESNFNVLNKTVIDDLPGSVKGKKERGEEDERLKACLTLTELYQLLIRVFRKYNNSHYIKDYPLTEDMIRDGVQPIPVDLWKWGIAKSGAIRFYEEDVLKLNLLPNDVATITDRGIEFEGLHYTCDTAGKEHWFARPKGKYKKREKVEISYDPRFTKHIYIRHKDDATSFEPCTMIDEQHHAFDKAWLDYLDIKNAISEERFPLVGKELDASVTLDSEIENIVESAKLRAKDLNISKREQTRSINENTKVDKEKNRLKERFDLTNQTSNEDQAKTYNDAVNVLPFTGGAQISSTSTSFTRKATSRTKVLLNNKDRSKK
jgi:hypothetical protein